jgi:hypothetical protein
MQRPVFRDGRLLRTSDFVDEQAYHLSTHRQHNTTGHTWGIAAGLELLLVDGDMVVSPGVAVDGFGRDVVLSESRALDLRPFDQRGVDAVDVWVGYDRVDLPAAGDGVDAYLDSAAIQLTDAADVDPRRPPGVDPADLVTIAGASSPDDPARRWPVYLGRVIRDLAHPEKPPVVQGDDRPWIGLVGAAVQTADAQEWLTFSGGAQPVVEVGLKGSPGRLRVTQPGGVELDGRLTVDGDLVLRGGSLSLDPTPPSSTAPPAVPPEWSLSHGEDDVAHELRLTMPAPGPLPQRLVVGAWRDGAFLPSLTMDDAGTITISGNLVVSGRLQASSVQEAQLSDAGRAFLAGAQTASLLSLFVSPV